MLPTIRLQNLKRSISSSEQFVQNLFVFIYRNRIQLAIRQSKLFVVFVSILVFVCVYEQRYLKHVDIEASIKL